ncbi:MAG TPA: hypothetical protein DCQ99_08545 [Nitrospinae bacterium]|nr:hypothetical protein [Nitrospinota bacterium]HBA26382.1 hypothetical protein [Nitrospinota bacterium]
MKGMPFSSVLQGIKNTGTFKRQEIGIIMEIRCSEKADKQIKKICKGDRKSAKIITKAIEAY